MITSEMCDAYFAGWKAYIGGYENRNPYEPGSDSANAFEDGVMDAKFHEKEKGYEEAESDCCFA